MSRCRDFFTAVKCRHKKERQAQIRKAPRIRTRSFGRRPRGLGGLGCRRPTATTCLFAFRSQLLPESEAPPSPASHPDSGPAEAAGCSTTEEPRPTRPNSIFANLVKLAVVAPLLLLLRSLCGPYTATASGRTLYLSLAVCPFATRNAAAACSRSSALLSSRRRCFGGWSGTSGVLPLISSTPCRCIRSRLPIRNQFIRPAAVTHSFKHAPSRAAGRVAGRALLGRIWDF